MGRGIERLRTYYGPKDIEWLLRCTIPVPFSGCWIWLGATDSKGYANSIIGGKFVGVHRYAYELRHGAIPGDMTIDHLCRVTCCVNPDHLEAVTHRQNVLRGTSKPAVHAVKTHCVHGHPLSGENLASRNARHRRCKACNRISQAELRKRRRVAMAPTTGVR